VVNSAARSARSQRRLREQTAERNQRYSIATFFGRSPAAQGLREMVAKLTRVPFSALLLTGETGTGKGLVARIVHYGGARQEAPLVEVNCAALPRDLLESELFGFEPGAFTGAKGRHRGLMEQAQGGTLFLDEVSELGVDLQAKLLKAIEDRRFRRLAGSIEIDIDVQLVAATNRDLQECIQAGLFRADLYHRLSVFSLELPPLRVRKEDLEDLVPLFVAEFNAKAGKAVRIIPEQIWDKLRAYDWPGNVRELRNVVERCVLLSENEVFPLQWLQLHAAEPSSSPLAHPQGEGLWLPFDGSITLDDMDCYIIKIALERAHFNVTAAARLLGTTRQTLRYRIQKYGLKSSG
jgi:two-component system response regulator AtoC